MGARSIIVIGLGVSGGQPFRGVLSTDKILIHGVEELTVLLVAHLIALGIWIGVVGAEFAIEFDGMKDDESFVKASYMHYATDIWIEIPAFTLVLVTGFMMLNDNHLSGLFLYKVAFGLLAVIFNIVCVYAVFKRKKFAEESDLEGMRSVNSLMRVGGLVIPTFLIALILGILFALKSIA